MKHGDVIYRKDGATATPITLPDGSTDLIFRRAQIAQRYCGGCWRVVRPKRGQCPTCHRRF